MVSELLELKSATEAKASSKTTDHLAVKECIVAEWASLKLCYMRIFNRTLLGSGCGAKLQLRATREGLPQK